ncbi:hypothetical protein [Bradyrhizobium sp. UFLA05-112]
MVSQVPKDLLARTAAFLLLKDLKSSYVIEGERPPQDRIQRWGSEAGRAALDVAELLRLQRIVIGDERFVKLGFRTEGGFVGEHDRETQRPIPDHISARQEDIDSLIRGLIAFDQAAENELDPVVAAAVLAFGFVYIDPFEEWPYSPVPHAPCSGAARVQSCRNPLSCFSSNSRQDRRIQGSVGKLFESIASVC